MGIIGWIVLGLGAGAIAKTLHRGSHEPAGLLGTMVLGVVGAVLGGLIASALGVAAVSSFFSIGTWVIAVVGAFLVLVIYSAVVETRTRSGRRSASDERLPWS